MPRRCWCSMRSRRRWRGRGQAERARRRQERRLRRGPERCRHGAAAVARAAKAIAKAPIHAYRWTLKPLIGWECRHLPTCSEYALEAIELQRRLARQLAGAVARVPLPPVGHARLRSACPTSAASAIRWRPGATAAGGCARRLRPGALRPADALSCRRGGPAAPRPRARPALWRARTTCAPRRGRGATPCDLQAGQLGRIEGRGQLDGAAAQGPLPPPAGRTCARRRYCPARDGARPGPPASRRAPVSSADSSRRGAASCAIGPRAGAGGGVQRRAWAAVGAGLFGGAMMADGPTTSAVRASASMRAVDADELMMISERPETPAGTIGLERRQAEQRDGPRAGRDGMALRERDAGAAGRAGARSCCAGRRAGGPDLNRQAVCDAGSATMVGATTMRGSPRCAAPRRDAMPTQCTAQRQRSARAERQRAACRCGRARCSAGPRAVLSAEQSSMLASLSARSRTACRMRSRSCAALLLALLLAPLEELLEQPLLLGRIGRRRARRLLARQLRVDAAGGGVPAGPWRPPSASASRPPPSSGSSPARWRRD